MEVPNEKDIAFTENGDIDIAELNYQMQWSHLNEITGVNVIKQIIINRIKSAKPDWFFDHVGADLEKILGEENTKSLAAYGANLIIKSLAGDGFIDQSDLYIKAVPVDLFTVTYNLAVNISGGKPLLFKISIALNAGINIEEVA